LYRKQQIGREKNGRRRRIEGRDFFFSQHLHGEGPLKEKRHAREPRGEAVRERGAARPAVKTRRQERFSPVSTVSICQGGKRKGKLEKGEHAERSATQRRLS